MIKLSTLRAMARTEFGPFAHVFEFRLPSGWGCILIKPDERTFFTSGTRRADVRSITKIYLQPVKNPKTP